jgi:hypothetical protein
MNANGSSQLWRLILLKIFILEALTSSDQRIHQFLTTLFPISTSAEAELLDEIQAKVFRVVLLVIHSHLYSFA